MPIYEYVAERCQKQPSCSRRKEYLQRVADSPLTECRDCGAPIRRVFSSFAARSGSVGVSSPDPTPLNITGLPPPSGMPEGGGGEGGCGHEH
ncbi:MAG: zinc ribbon domain-containing protein [Nitrospira sp.]|nr:zinc ribbon domain-containing protein [Nitrospira sp.]